MGIVYLEKIDKVIYFGFVLLVFLSYASIGNRLFNAQCVVGIAAHCTLFPICMALTQFCLVECAFFPDPIEPLCPLCVCDLNSNSNSHTRCLIHKPFRSPSESQNELKFSFRKKVLSRLSLLIIYLRIILLH